MPIFRSGKGNAPQWCELETFEFIELKRNQTKRLARAGRKEELLVCKGTVTIRLDDLECTLVEGGKLDLNGPGMKSLVMRVGGDALVCRMAGRWQSITSSGIFGAQTATPLTFDTPYSYKKTTGFDNHYHDCDEYWIVFQGRATVASEGRIYEVKPGDCVATGMGWHHDVIAVKDHPPFRAIWFEGTLEGQKRTGHLWEPRHGTAHPHQART